jgi:hypothetical protein
LNAELLKHGLTKSAFWIALRTHYYHGAIPAMTFHDKKLDNPPFPALLAPMSMSSLPARLVACQLLENWPIVTPPSGRKKLSKAKNI